MSVVPGKQNFKKYFGVEVPAVDFIYEDELCVVFDEMKNPQAPVHFLVVPKDIIPRLMDTNETDEKLLGHLLTVAKRAATLKGLEKHGFRVVMNEGPQSSHLLLVANKTVIDKNVYKTGYHLVVDEDFRSKRLKALHVFGRALNHMLWPTGPGERL